MLRREYLYDDAGYAEEWRCPICDKPIGIEEVDRNLIADFVHCDECMAALMADYAEYEEAESPFRRRVLRALQRAGAWMSNVWLRIAWSLPTSKGSTDKRLPF